MTAVEVAVRNLTSLLADADEIRLTMVREAALKKLDAIGLSAPGRLLDAALPKHQATEDESAGQTLTLADPEPWPAPVNVRELLDNITALIRRYVIVSLESLYAVALWVMHAHALGAFTISPILAITSPTKRCGKTTTLEIISMLVPRAIAASNITPASLFRSVEKFKPTLLIDEADTFLGENDELRGIINAGHRKLSAFIVRIVGEEHEPRRFLIWCAKVIALIGKLSDTIEDRSIVISMKRRAPGEKIEAFRPDRLSPECEEICRKAARWVADHQSALGTADPEVPVGLNDRAADNWRPLLAIADLAGGEWPARARKAATALSDGVIESDSSALVKLLEDLRELFDRGDKLFSVDICEALGVREDRPWSEWRKGKPITVRQLAQLLAPLGIKPKSTRIGEETGKGYELEQFSDPFSRYLPLSIRHTVTNQENQHLCLKSIRHKTSM
jgi:putative DNA primase/helicase